MKSRNAAALFVAVLMMASMVAILSMDLGEGGGSPVIGAPADPLVEIENSMSISDINSAIVNALKDNPVVTVTGSKTGGSGDGSTLNIYLRSDREMIWDAELDFDCLINMTGRGSFTATSDSVLDLRYITISGEGLNAEFNCDITAKGMNVNKMVYLTLNGDLTFDGDGSESYFQDNSVVTINGAFTINGDGNYFNGDYGHLVMTVTGGITVNGDYNAMWFGGKTTVNGGVTFTGEGCYLCLETGNNPNVTINGGVTFVGESCELAIQERVVATINGGVTFTGDDCSIYAQNRPNATINGGVTFVGDGCYIETRNRVVLNINNGVTFDGEGCYIEMIDDSSLTLNGGVSFDGDKSRIKAGTEGDGSVALTIGGDLTMDGDSGAINVGKNGEDNYSTFILNGNLTTNGNYAIRTETNATVKVNGNVTSEKIGVLSIGGYVNITGTLTADPDEYIGFWSEDDTDWIFMKEDEYAIVSGYRVYDGSLIVGSPAKVSFNPAGNVTLVPVSGSGEVEIKNSMSIEDIENAIADALNDNAVVTVIGSKTDGDGGGDILHINLRSDRKMIWDAELDFDCGIEMRGRGSFTATSGSVLKVGTIDINGEGVKAEINCDVSATGLYLNMNAQLTVNGDILFADGSEAEVDNNAVLTVNGGVTFDGDYCSLDTNGAGHVVVKITGGVTFDGDSGYMHLSGTVTIDGGVTFNGENGRLRGDSGNNPNVTINGGVTFNGDNSYLSNEDRCVVTINGGVTFNGDKCYIEANNRSVTTINGGVTFNGEGCYMDLWNDSAVNISNGATFVGDDSYIEVGVNGDGNAALTIKGDLTMNGANGYIDVGKNGKDNFSTFTLNGNLTTSGDYAIYTETNATVKVNGDVTSENIGVLSAGGSVNITGKLTADPDRYIGFWDDDDVDYVYLLEEEYTTVDGYRVYDGSDIVGVNAVVSFKPADADGGDGGSNTLIIAVVAIAAIAVIGVLVYFFVLKKK